MVPSAEHMLRQAIAEAPIRAARQALRLAQVVVAEPLDASTLAYLSDETDCLLGSCEFKPDVIHRGPLLDRPLFSLKGISLPRAYYDEYLESEARRGAITRSDQSRRLLYAPIHTVAVTLLDQSRNLSQNAVIFAAPDMPITAVYSDDVQRAHALTSRDMWADNDDLAVLGFIKLALHKLPDTLGDNDCAVLSHAIAATALTPQ